MDDFVSEHKLDTDNHVTHLFFASRQSLDLYHCYPEVLLLDCTYNTNKYGLPLLNVVGITGINSTFLVCCAFVKSEGEDDFHWVLQKLSSYVSLSPGVVVTDCDYALMNVLNHVFPTSALLLCRWHIRRSLLTHTKAHFSSCRTSERRRAGAAVLEDAGGVSAAAAENFMKDWDNIVFAVTVATYREKWRDLQRRYRRETALIDYIRSTWLPLKEHFMAPWVDEHLHLGATETSRVEGFHSVLKQLLTLRLLLISVL
jgi:hypothetical protein